MIFDLNLGYKLVSEYLLLQLLISIITYNRKEHILCIFERVEYIDQSF